MSQSVSEPAKSLVPASKLRTPAQRIVVQGHRVSCDGGGGALGHPKVWYELGSDGEVECLYCGRVFVQQS
jgi:uncharacterized Zn-finger protein